jgi:hypothetical protein
MGRVQKTGSRSIPVLLLRWPYIPPYPRYRLCGRRFARELHIDGIALAAEPSRPHRPVLGALTVSLPGSLRPSAKRLMHYYTPCSRG